MRDHSLNVENRREICNINSCETTDSIERNRDEISKIQTKHSIGNINVTTPTNKIHLGSKVVIHGPAILSGVSIEDVICNKENCQCKNGTFEHKQSRKVKHRMLDEIKSEVIKNWNVKKCVLAGFIHIFIVIFLLVLHFLFYQETKSFNIISQLNEMNYNLPNFIPRKDWGSTHECTFYCNVNTKNRIRFTILRSIWWYCFQENKDCKDSFEDEFNINYKNSKRPFNDIYYNYIIGLKNEIYEGRYINCTFDEDFLDGTFLSVITIGITYCFPGNSNTNKNYIKNEFQTIQLLLDTLKNKNILERNYLLEFPEICKNTLLINLFIENHYQISFYKNEQNFIVSSNWNPEIMKTFLFLSDNNINISNVTYLTHDDREYPITTVTTSMPDILYTDQDSDNMTTLNVLHKELLLQSKIVTTSDVPLVTHHSSISSRSPTSSSILNNNTNNGFTGISRIKTVDRITVRFIYVALRYLYTCTHLKECWTDIKSRIDNHELNKYKIAYFVGLRFGGFIYKRNATFLSEYLENNMIKVGIVVSGYFSKLYDPYDSIKSLSDLLQPIEIEIKKRINFTAVNIEFQCNKKLLEPKLNFHNFYEMLTDVSKVEC